MHMRLLPLDLTVALLSAIAVAQTPTAKPARKTPAPKAAPRPSGTLAQVMRGIYFPSANLIYDVQQADPGAPKKKSGESTGSSTEKYGGAYEGWDVVENAAIAITDGVDLILKPGRMCENGKPVPLQRADYQQFARDMRKAGLVALAAARAKNRDKVIEATGDIADACNSCHEIYRNVGPADSPLRCTPPARAK